MVQGPSGGGSTLIGEIINVSSKRSMYVGDETARFGTHHAVVASLPVITQAGKGGRGGHLFRPNLNKPTLVFPNFKCSGFVLHDNS